MNPILEQILGFIFTIIGLSLLINRTGLPSLIEEAAHSKAFWWIYGLIALVFGSVLVGVNNVWSSGVELIVTVIGWLAVIKGAFILVFPRAASSFYRKICKANAVVVSGLVIFVFGIVLVSYSGFF